MITSCCAMMSKGTYGKIPCYCSKVWVVYHFNGLTLRPWKHILCVLSERATSEDENDTSTSNTQQNNINNHMPKTTKLSWSLTSYRNLKYSNTLSRSPLPTADAFEAVKNCRPKECEQINMTVRHEIDCITLN